MRKLRVLHLHFGKDGGAERFFVNLANAFGEREIEQKFIIRPNREWRSEISQLGEVIENHGRKFFLSGMIASWKIQSILKDWQPDAVMAWMPRASSFIPNVDGVVTLVRLGDFPRHLNHFRYCDVVVGNIPGIAQHCRELGWQGETQTISNFPREVEPKAVSRSMLNTPEDAFVISNAGRFVPRKGFDLMIRAAAKVPNSYLWLIGDGRERQELEKLAKDEGVIERTRFIGWVDEPIHYLAASDVLVMPSRHEPLGNVILEAWQADIPVISTRSEGPSWYMDNGENGLLVDIDDLEGVVHAINQVRLDASLAQKLREGGRLKLSNFFSKNRIVDQYMSLFSSKT